MRGLVEICRRSAPQHRFLKCGNAQASLSLPIILKIPPYWYIETASPLSRLWRYGELSAILETKWYEYAIRFVVGGRVTVMTGMIAKEFGPVAGGLFLGLPWL